MDNDLISRSALLEALTNRDLSDEFYDHGLDWEKASLETKRAVEVQGTAIKRMIQFAPAVNADPARKRGKWIYNDNVIEPWVTCNLCGHDTFYLHSRYCPNCGAEMEDYE